MVYMWVARLLTRSSISQSKGAFLLMASAQICLGGKISISCWRVSIINFPFHDFPLGYIPEFQNTLFYSSNLHFVI
jgi:hypothetical protein